MYIHENNEGQDLERSESKSDKYRLFFLVAHLSPCKESDRPTDFGKNQSA